MGDFLLLPLLRKCIHIHHRIVFTVVLLLRELKKFNLFSTLLLIFCCYFLLRWSPIRVTEYVVLPLESLLLLLVLSFRDLNLVKHVVVWVF